MTYVLLKELRHFNWNKCRYYHVIKHYYSRALGLTHNLLVRSVLLIICFCVVLLYVFTFWVPCCGVRCGFRNRNDVWFVLPPALCRKVHVLLIMCVCLRIAMSNTYCVVFLFCLSLSCVPHGASFSGWFILDYPFGIL